MDLEFEGRRALIVGGSYGIGFAVARQFAAEGGEVAIVSRGAENLRRASEAIRDATGRRPAVEVADVTRPEAAEQLAAKTAVRWAALDVLVTAVGGSVRAAFADLTEEQWLDNYRLNVLSTVRCLRAMLPLLKRGNAPAIVILGAASAKMPYAQQIVSNVHKAGLLGLTKTLAGELAAEGIRVNCVGPGRTLTPLWLNRADRMAEERGISREDVLAEFSKDIPLGRFADPEEVAVMVTWLASRRASYITGQAVNVDGGIARGLL
jgi:3-oxoacyl-[acyl-carrier protein] reductase